MNKPKLIDANNVRFMLEFDGKWFKDEIDDIMKVIDRMVPDYDIDKVVEQLESLKQHEQEHHAYATVWGIEQSIEIVKGGLDGSRNDSTSR